MINKYPGRCRCGKRVESYEGYLLKEARGYVVVCQSCFDKNDHSSYEDRCCGDSAYEDRCAEMCGY